MKRVLIITAHRRDRAPNQRFRFEQYFDFLSQNGYEIYFSNLLSEADDKVFYNPGHTFSKGVIVLKAIMKRLSDVLFRRKYDLIFICREGFLAGTTIFEELLSRSGAPIIYDFDDAIWHFDVSEANRKFGWLKNPGKTARLIAISDLVFAGNAYLADYAHHHNDNVVIIPTTINTDEYLPVVQSDVETVCIGWSGSITTIRHFELALPFLRILKEKYKQKIRIKVIGDGRYRNEEFGIVGIPWKKDDELKELSEIQIGIMPLPDDEWAKGKCGLKGLQYMALGIATIMSPVGVNAEIIDDGQNGFLAVSPEEWARKISLLIDDFNLRSRIAANGRKTVEEKYSVNSTKDLYLKYFDQLTGRKNS